MNSIGISISYLFFTTLNDKYNNIYFNLKDVFKYSCDVKEYFIKSLMKYYLNFHNEDNINDVNDDLIKLEYSFYMKHKAIIEKKIATNNFWDILMIFCEEIELFSNSIIIIDQYKPEYDENKQLYNIINYCMQKKNIKFIISSTLGDNRIKQDFILNLKYLIKNSVKYEEYVSDNIKEESNEENMDIENKLFYDFSFNNEIEDIKLPNNKFDKIIIPNNNNNQNIKPVKNNKIFEPNDDSDICIPFYDKTKIIYINNLISMENIIEKNHQKYFNIFKYSPKIYNKFKMMLSKYKYDLNDESFLILLEKIYEKIENKVNDFYLNIRKRNLLQESEESLKGTYIIKLMDIIKHKETIDYKTLIEYLKIFPFKYIKIYIKDESLENNNFININDELINKKFVIDYAYEFVKLVFLRIS